MILYILLGGCGFLLILLGWEYQSLRMHVQKVHLLQDQYYGCIDAVQRMLCQQKRQHTAFQAKKFLASVDRTPSYLKESANSYLRAQQLGELLYQMDMSEWEDVEQVVHADDVQEVIAQDSREVSDQEMEKAISQWAQTVRRDSETGIAFICPLDRSRFWLSSLFGSRKKPNGHIGFHQGIDMAACRGTDVHAAAAGTVEYAGNASGYGNTIVVVHDAVYKTRYAHLDEIGVCANQKIAQGDIIGAVGDTGFTIKQGSDASHLHFELYERGKQINPLAFVSL